jgi:hypothetical protein
MSAIIRGLPLCWGANPLWLTLPITNVSPLAKKVRRRIRSNSVAFAFVKTQTSIEKWILEPVPNLDNPTSLRLGILIGANETTSNQPPATSIQP